MSTVEIESIFDIVLDTDADNDNGSDNQAKLETILEEYNEDFDFDYINTIVDEEDRPIIISTTTTTTTTTSCSNEDEPSTPSQEYVVKRFRTDDDQLETLPAYLQIKNSLRDQITVPISTQHLEELLLLKHKIAALQLDQELYNAYLKFGAGQWKTTTVSKRTTVDRRVWFDDLKKFESSEQTIGQYRKEFEQRQRQLNIDIEQQLTVFIEQHDLPILEEEFNHKIALYEYDYDIELLLREYQEQKPTAEQIELAQYIFALKIKYTEPKLELLEIKQHILRQQQLPPRCSKVPDPYIDITEINRAHSGLVELILRTEKAIHDYQRIFDEEIHRNRDINSKLIYLIHQSLKIIDKKLHHIHDFKMKRTFSKQFSIPCLPSFIIDTALNSHGLTHEQIQLLNRGPTYVPPFQMYIQSTDGHLHKQYKYLQQHLTKLYAQFNINPARSMFINKDIKDLYMNSFSITLPNKFHQRAVYENQLVNSIRTHCQVNKLILKRLANHSNMFYLGHSVDYQDKVNDYLIRMNVFEMCELIDDKQLQSTHDYLNQIIATTNEHISDILEKKKKKKKNSKDLIRKLHIDHSKVRLPYLYFLPEITRRDGCTLKPIVVARKSATSRLAHFLDQLLRPIVQRHSQGTTFTNGTDFIYKLNEFTTDKKRFHPSTKFATITIKYLETMLTHGELLLTLQEYLNENLALPFIENFSINEIIRLTSMFLHHTRVYYDHKIYRFLKGSPSSLPFTDTLLNISAFQWQKNLLQEPLVNREFYGRCKNRIFFTWNDTQDKFDDFVSKLASKYPDLRLDVTFGPQTHFFDVFIENFNRTFHTSVYHDGDDFQYVLPYVTVNPKDAHSHWLRSALIRAVRYCTYVSDFNRERIHLEVACLAYGYPLEFIEERLQHFYKHFEVESLRTSLDQTIYDKLRHRLFNFISEQHEFSRIKNDSENSNRRITLTYAYEYGPKNKFEKQLRAILVKHLQPTNTTTTTTPSSASSSLSYSSNSKKLKVVLHSKQQYSLNALLTEQKPNHPLINENNITL